MTVDYVRRETPAPLDLIARLEQRIGRALPASYRGYLLQQDGGQLDDNSEAVTTVFGLREGPDGDLWQQLDAYHDRIPQWLLPVARDAFGNLFAVSLRDRDAGTVWFWDHEEEADEGEPPTTDNIELKAPDWPIFLASLSPIDDAVSDEPDRNRP
jgi:hypothetical protein